jgi:hypothetical protein
VEPESKSVLGESWGKSAGQYSIEEEILGFKVFILGPISRLQKWRCGGIENNISVFVL